MLLARRAVGERPGPLGPTARGQARPIIGHSNCASTSALGLVSLDLRLGNRTGVDRVATTTRATLGVIGQGDGMCGLTPNATSPIDSSPSANANAGFRCPGEHARPAKQPLCSHTPISHEPAVHIQTMPVRPTAMCTRGVTDPRLSGS
jgi:hypothetical protein